MKTLILLVTAFLFASISPSFGGKPGPHSPIQEARDHLERAHSLLTKKEEGTGGKKKGRPTIPNIVNALNNAEVSLEEAKKNKGTHANDALKLIAHAKEELDLAKTGGEEHLGNAEKDIDEALKRVMLAIRVNQ